MSYLKASTSLKGGTKFLTIVPEAFQLGHPLLSEGWHQIFNLRQDLADPVLQLQPIQIFDLRSGAS
jgi:hypothetical protein